MTRSSMPTLTSEASATDARFEQNDAAQRELVADLTRRLATAAAGGPERARERHVARGPGQRCRGRAQDAQCPSRLLRHDHKCATTHRQKAERLLS